MSREISFKDELRDVIQNAIKDRRFEGIEIVKVESGYTLDNREVDLTLFMKGGLPFMFIETKRKARGREERKKFDAFAPGVIGQVVSYVFLQKKSGLHVPFFATANPGFIAVFRTPENIEDFVDAQKVEEREYEKVLRPGRLQELLTKYMVIGKSLELRKEFFQEILDNLAKDYVSETKILRVELSFALIEQFRNFVEDVSESCKDLVKYRMEYDSTLKQELEKLEKDAGYTHTPESLAKMMAYVLMNKLIFYKVLEKKYTVPKLTVLDSSSSTTFANQLNYYFRKATEVTKDFEPIFMTGIYDMLPFPDESETLERINDFISFLDSIEVERIGELVGYIYEELIPANERHALGQFYTPPPICELITKWAIRNQDDKVLDPGVGSGGFIIHAYKRLLKLKTGKEKASDKDHEKILGQLYAIDINPFPAHLTAMNLAMKNVSAPSTNTNIIVRDFFQTAPEQELFAPYVIKTAAGEFKKKIIIPKCDAVIGNPPYTRWNEIPDSTKRSILSNLKDEISRYKLIREFGRGLRAARNPGIYTFWIIHSTKFLKESGRLGMIISNLWLQTDYGIRFSNFLIDHYKIKAIIDFSQRLFSIPLISTLVILMEKCSDEKMRMDNDVKFIYVGRETSVDELLKIIDGEKGGKEDVYVKTVKQSNLPRDKTWIQFFALPYEEFEKNYAKELVIRASEIFDISRGNVTWFMKKLAGSGADPFFYLTPSNVIAHDLSEYLGTCVYPALTSARHCEYYTFTKDDWEQLRNKDKECYMFVCHKPLHELPSKIKDYINWGQTECRVSEKRGGGFLCSEATACRLRGKTRGFYGWYDIGEVVEAPIFAIYQAWHKTRFMRSYFNVAMYHGLISLIPKVKLSEEQIKAFLAYLNSSFSQYYIETHGRRSGGGIIALEVNIAKEMPILDMRKLSDEQVKVLAKKFDELEAEARKIGGASESEQVEKLKPKIYEIDAEIGKILKVPQDVIIQVQESVELLIDRRVSGAKEAMPETVKGEEPFKARPKKSTKRKEKAEDNFRPLTDFV
ncbi:MAG: N-6 DNA methylase [Nitrososphaeria archaeon]